MRVNFFDSPKIEEVERVKNNLLGLGVEEWRINIKKIDYSHVLFLTEVKNTTQWRDLELGAGLE